MKLGHLAFFFLIFDEKNMFGEGFQLLLSNTYSWSPRKLQCIRGHVFFAWQKNSNFCMTLMLHCLIITLQNKHYCRNMLKCKWLDLNFYSVVFFWLLEFARVLSAMWDKRTGKERTFLIYGMFTGERKRLFLLINKNLPVITYEWQTVTNMWECSNNKKKTQQP